MTPTQFNRAVRGQLDQLRREGLLDEAAYLRLAQRYPVQGWHWQNLGRWFLIFGGISLAGGMAMLLPDWFEFTLKALAVLLAALMAGLFAGSWALRERPWLWTCRSLELLGGFTLIGLSFVLGIIYSSGSGDWPSLLLVDLLLLLPLSYGLRNPLLLVLSAVLFFTWFGGMTGYASGWGAYWFGMNYPARFLAAGVVIAGIGVLHRQAEAAWLGRYSGFFYIWLASGVFFAEMALWLLSLFGNFGSIWEGYGEPKAAELALFNLLWAGGNAALLGLGLRHALRMLRGFAVTFLIIQGYTLFFWQVAGHLGPVLSLLVAGGSALWLVAWLERRRRGVAFVEDG